MHPCVNIIPKQIKRQLNYWFFNLEISLQIFFFIVLNSVVLMVEKKNRFHFVLIIHHSYESIVILYSSELRSAKN